LFLVFGKSNRKFCYEAEASQLALFTIMCANYCFSGIEHMVRHWDAIYDESQRAMTSLPTTSDYAKPHKD
jgi:hypothetical protein